jgi:hypothetical protein
MEVNGRKGERGGMDLSPHMVVLDMLYFPSLYARGTYLLACFPDAVMARSVFHH